MFEICLSNLSSLIIGNYDLQDNLKEQFECKIIEMLWQLICALNNFKPTFCNSIFRMKELKYS